MDAYTLAAMLTWMGERAYHLAALGLAPFDDELRLLDGLTEVWLSVIYSGPPDRPAAGESRAG